MRSQPERRKRAGSLRTQLFNKNLFERFQDNNNSNLELESISETQLPVEVVNVTDTMDIGKEYKSETYSKGEVLMENNDYLDLSNDDNLNHNDRSIYNEGIRNDDRGDEFEEIYEYMENNKFVEFLNSLVDTVLNRKRDVHSKHGRNIPISLNYQDKKEFTNYVDLKSKNLLDERFNRPYCNNIIRSSRYSIFSFFPRQLYFQFSKLANVYFFVIAILQMIPGWSTTGRFTTIIPLCAFMAISMAREAWDDYKRYRMDKEENNHKATILRIDTNNSSTCNNNEINSQAMNSQDNLDPKYMPRGDANLRKASTGESYSFTNFEYMKNKYGVDVYKVAWRDIKVGDFLILEQDDWIPADLLLLTSDSENNECFVETMALDGETNLKLKQPHPKISKICKTADGLVNFKAKATVEDPNIDLYNFEGNIQLYDNSQINFSQYPLSSDNVVYRGSILRNTKTVIGMVMTTGEETKIRMNALKNPRTKAPKLQKKINLIILFMVFVVATVSFFSYFGHVLGDRQSIEGNKAWYLFNKNPGTAPSIMGFIIMYNTMIPLSLYVTMEIIKVMQSKFMEWDIDMYYEENDTPCDSKAATILEELGQVSYIFSDKTGTLTDNKMLFRKFSICGSSWLHLTDNDNTLNREKNGAEKVDNQSNDDLDVVSIDDKSLLDKFNFTKDEESIKYPDVSNSNNHRQSIEYKGNSATIFTGRPSMRSLYQAKMSLDINKNDKSLFVNDQAFQKPLSSDNKFEMKEVYIPEIKTSYDLIQFIQLNPNNVFAEKAKFFILSLALCHSCLPKKINDEIEENHSSNSEPFDDPIEYQSSSPDELALVTAARELGYVVTNKNSSFLTLKTYPKGFDRSPVIEDYEILNYIDFDSQRKRMSVLVRLPHQNDRVLLICKGADNVILERLSNRRLVNEKMEEADYNTRNRKDAEAELILDQRKSLEKFFGEDDLSSKRLRNSMSLDARDSLSLTMIKRNMSNKRRVSNKYDTEMQIDSIDQILDVVKHSDQEIEAVIAKSRQSVQKQQIEKYGPRGSIGYRKSFDFSIDKGDGYKNIAEIKSNYSVSKETSRIMDYIGGEELINDEEYVLEKTLQALDDFSTEGLRTLLYSYKWIPNAEYNTWAKRYHDAKTSLVDRSLKIATVGEEIEDKLELLGATAIEDKLQEGVAESIEKLRRAGIKMWMLTGDKRETAINIGYSCKLIYDYSTVVVLTINDKNILSKLNAILQEINSGNIAHCVLVIDGATLAMYENNPTLMSVFVELCTKTDSVICCRASPSQKALIVTNIRNTKKDMVTLAIGDGANDIAMIQAADIGVGIAGKEGLQAARTADFSIGQFRFLVKLLLVHGRYNYIRTSKFILSTFYKELAFYLTQLIFQRNTLFSGTSLYESFSLSMFNTLFTSLPVLCIGMFEQDLRPSTLLTVPELYSTGRLCKGFNFWIVLEWMVQGGVDAVLVGFLGILIYGYSALKDNTLYPMGSINFTAIVLLVNIRTQFLEMNNRNWLAFTSVIVSCGGWMLWLVALPVLNKNDVIYDVPYGFIHNFGGDITFWCSVLILTVLPITLHIILKTFKVLVFPSDADIFSELEQRSDLRRTLESGAFNEMKQGWTWKKDENSFIRYKNMILKPKQAINSSNTNPNLDTDMDTIHSLNSRNIVRDVLPEKYSSDKYEILPSGKIIKRVSIDEKSVNDGITNNFSSVKQKLSKKLRFHRENDEDVMAVVEQRLRDLE